jgi:hypothetical protein
MRVPKDILAALAMQVLEDILAQLATPDQTVPLGQLVLERLVTQAVLVALVMLVQLVLVVLMAQPV